MRSTFGGLEIARRGLGAQQIGIDVTGHNIANVNTPGYSRQRVELESTSPLIYGGSRYPLAVGTGVQATAIARMRDSFVDEQVRKEIHNSGYWEQQQEVLSQLELIFTEPSDSGISEALTEFWSGWEDLGNRPEDPSLRAVVREQAVSFTESVRHLYKQMVDLEHDLDNKLRLQAQEINSLAQQIADVNGLVAKAQAQGAEPNDLLDQRDQLLEELSKLTNISVLPQAAGQLNVNIGGISLVSGDTIRKLTFSEPEGVPAVIKWEGLGREVDFQGGQMTGLIAARDQIVPSYRARLDDFAATFITEFNSIHASGYGLGNQTGIDFFQGTGAQDWTVNPAILDDTADGLSLLAAASNPDSSGDGSNALELAALREKVLAFSSASGTVGNFFGSLISSLGVESKNAQRMAENQSQLVEKLSTWQESISGVSLDEEMTNLIRFQHAYSAAARVVTTIDEMLDTIIGSMGLVGR
jgi:flagellar hook-associated protein 1 FlgK